MEEYNRQLWDSIDEKCSFAEKSKARQSFSEFRRVVESLDSGKRARPGISRWLFFAAAVVSVSLTVLSTVLIFRKSETPVWQELSTRPGQSTQVVLADNTRVTMNGGSTIVYPSFFTEDNRQVYFNGEGYFEVSADETHPFDIIVNDARIQVTGTRFNLKSYSYDKVISVGLDEGHVQFESESDRSDRMAVHMVPGDHLSFDRETGVVEKHFSSTDSGLWRKGEYYFKNESLGDIARDIERIFGVRVLIEKEELLNTHYHLALVNGENLDELVQILSRDKTLNVSCDGNTLVIR